MSEREDLPVDKIYPIIGPDGDVVCNYTFNALPGDLKVIAAADREVKVFTLRDVDLANFQPFDLPQGDSIH